MRAALADVRRELREILARYDEPPRLRQLHLERRAGRFFLHLHLSDGAHDLIAVADVARHSERRFEAAARAAYAVLSRASGAAGQEAAAAPGAGRDRAMVQDSRDYTLPLYEQWGRETLADPEIGGAGHRQAMEQIHYLVASYTNGRERHELMRLLDQTGLSNNPTLLRFLHRVATERDAERERLNHAVELAVRPPLFMGVDRATAENLITPSMRENMRAAFAAGEIAPNMTAYEVDQRQVELVRDIQAIQQRTSSAFLYDTGNPREARRSDEAAARGMALLKSWLSPEQLAQFEREHQFDVVGSATRRRYRISVQNVFELDGRGNVGSGLCFAPAGDLVAGDVMLAQKIALETDEQAVLRVANRFSGVHFRGIPVRIADTFLDMPGLGSEREQVRTSLPEAAWRRVRRSLR
jgi:hypothetical protein